MHYTSSSAHISLFPHARAAPLFLNALLGARTLCLEPDCARLGLVEIVSNALQHQIGWPAGRFPKVARHPFAAAAAASPNETLLAVLNKTSDLVRAYYLGHSLLLLRVRRRLIGCCAPLSLESRLAITDSLSDFNFASTTQTAQFVSIEFCSGAPRMVIKLVDFLSP